MKKKLIFASVLASTIFFGKAQNSSTENSTGIIKIVTVDEDGKKTEVIQVAQIPANIASNNARQIYAQISGLNIYQNDDAGLQLLKNFCYWQKEE